MNAKRKSAPKGPKGATLPPGVFTREELEWTRVKVLFQEFPQVQTVSDATAPIEIRVTQADVEKGTPKDMTECGLAVAVCRDQHADGALVRLGFTYVVKGTHATRYETGQHIAREIVSFDRSHIFQPGTYRLNAIPSYKRLGKYQRGKDTGTGKKVRKVPSVKLQRQQFTEGVRSWQREA